MDCHRGPQSRSEILYNNEDITGTATAVRFQSHSEILYNNEDITGTATAVRSPVVKYCV